MDFVEPDVAEIHQVGSEMIHLTRESIADSGEVLALLDGGEICLADAFVSTSEAAAWLREMFNRLYPAHQCGFGCIRMPGSEFIAPLEELERLAEAAPRRRG